ncbi:MAG: zinc ribbon domain-containing protein [Caldilineales bacterium]|nr:zinc ribbon domain-containing protein [Caldilineales bacterium]
MPIYDYSCENCGRPFSHLWRSIAQAEAGGSPTCPNCGSVSTVRVVSQVTVLGEPGGLTPSEKAQENAQIAKQASYTSREQIEKLRSAKDSN